MLKRTEGPVETEPDTRSGGSSDSVFYALSSPFSRVLFNLFLALSLPSLYWLGFKRGDFVDANFQLTLSSVTIATLMATFILARLRSYAKTRLLAYVMPVNFLIFATILAVIAVLRIDYSAFQLFYGTVGALVGTFLTTSMVRRSVRLQFVIPGGRTNEITLGAHYVRAPGVEEMQSLVEADRIDGAIIADLHYDHADEWERLFARAALRGIPVYHYRQIAETQSGQVKIDHLSENDLGSLIPNVPYMTTKRAIDIVSSLVLIPLLLIPFAIIALAVRLDSPGKAIFIQERMGFRGETFRMIKFRTMRERAVEDDQAAQRNDAMTQADDDRITRLGRFMRHTRIDELPQIFNVLKGEMSWIGPRPEAESLSRWYESELPFYSYRHIVRPGITGWAQVNQGHVVDVEDVNAKLRYDFYYVKNISMWLDFLIVLKTARVILTGSGAK
ncbi:MAG: exopolysaccharide biosynthesis polyprenyl glycosylphosphotransferase [Pseudomonadota bacterium]